MEEINSITELNEGDYIRVKGNGLDVKEKVDVIKKSEYKDTKTATLKPVNGITVTLTDTKHPLQDDGIITHVGAVTITKID